MRIEIVAGPAAGQDILLKSASTIVVGRGDQATFRVDDPRLSRNHCLFEHAPPYLLVRDLGSRNGTKVNGHRVDEAYLRAGDRVACGANVFLVHGDFRVPSPAGAPGAPPPVPDYELLRPIGRGGMGTVWLARHREDGRELAMKFISPEFAATEHAFEEFLREIQVLSRLRHRRIVSLVEAGLAGDQVFLAMEYIEGCSALDLLKGSGRVPLAVAAAVGVQTLEALDYIHARAYVHRDVKPANLLLKGGPAAPADVRLADFGLAKSLQQSGLSGPSMSGTAKGTLAYMSPDQIQDSMHAGPPADIYGTAATIFHLVSGRRVFEDTNVSRLIARVLEEDAPRLEGVPDAVAGIVSRALAKSPKERPTARELAGILERFAGS